MKVAITGASGHLGNNLINYLNSQDISVRILTHKNNVQNSGGQNLIYSGDIRFFSFKLFPLIWPIGI